MCCKRSNILCYKMGGEVGAGKVEDVYPLKAVVPWLPDEAMTAVLPPCVIYRGSTVNVPLGEEEHAKIIELCCRGDVPIIERRILDV